MAGINNQNQMAGKKQLRIEYILDRNKKARTPANLNVYVHVDKT